MPTACIGIGSNLGDRAAFIRLARKRLASLPKSKLVAFSSVFETQPIGPPGQGMYLNAAAMLETELEPLELLRLLRAIESETGRVRREKWAARTLDLDLLLYDDLILETDELTIPHPRMHERKFVLLPLIAIAPGLIHPKLKKSVCEMLETAG